MMCARLRCLAFAIAAIIVAAPALATEPIKFGIGLPLTGGLAQTGKAMLLTQQMWVEEVNAGGGLLGRKIELVFYDDQSSPSTIPASIPNCSMSIASMCCSPTAPIRSAPPCRSWCNGGKL